MYRASADIDFVIDPTHDQLDALARALDAEFDVSRSAMNEAMATRSTFNAIHEQTSFEIGFFIKGSAPFDDEELRRSVRHSVGEAGGSVLLKSAEDTILRKLEWFWRGGEVSERQWHDVVSVLAAARGQLDDTCLDHWARDLGIADLLRRAREETAGL